MPANPKYLSSPGQRFLKITAGILGGFIITILFHNALGSLLEEKGGIIITSAYSSFFLWAGLLAIAFMTKNGWKIWGIYIVLMVVFGVVIFMNK
ncbi:MAG: hypothetical protein AAF039_15270 [Bacteroidota bacterium]